MKDCIYNTDLDWIKILKSIGPEGEVNFWRKDKRYLHLSPGAYFYFMARGQRRIIGRGIFKELNFLSVDDAWKTYESRNGVESLSVFQRRLGEVFELSNTYNGPLGCIIIENVEWLNDDNYFSVDENIFPHYVLGAKFHERGSIPELEKLFQTENQIKEPISRYLSNESDDKYEDVEISNLEYPSDFHDSDEEVTRRQTIVYRIVRDTTLSLQIKTLYNSKCQLCDLIIESPNRERYAEAHHIKPLGKPHNGPDSANNIICVCPNCHAKLDYGIIRLGKSKIMLHERHEINQQFIDYHNENIYSKII
jgi:predicted HNH restriction endonuclease